MVEGNKEVSDSNDVTSAFHAAKRARFKDDLQKFKGVVPQQNGHWGAKIYAEYHRIWLGTFKSEREAAMAYDSATIKLRSRESRRNFPWNHQTVQEPHFQSHYSTEAVLSMIRDGNYQSKFATFVKNNKTQHGGGIGTSFKQIRVNEDEKLTSNQLFQKELTPSDVGKLNRLVIPKKYAVRYFPYDCGADDYKNNNVMENSGVGDIELVFYDMLRKAWKFRYCYWRSSQSYVFTRGWNRFVKDKNLRAKDTIVFYTCKPSNMGIEGRLFTLIDVIYNGDERRDCFGEMKRDLKQNLGNVLSFNEVEEDEDHDKQCEDGKELSALQSSRDAQKGLRLFGVHIN
ncbi:hypothetical protein L6164_012215 [Bauhinia variegata]|uniref:Uncharacterized protein n=1 Tax=Bauhinia variegata TaxID=167791 RepID=A0ACB9PAK4_BAUVA|nr:hypothetical protein L6164_012215 [Bauhinia variegata]